MSHAHFLLTKDRKKVNKKNSKFRALNFKREDLRKGSALQEALGSIQRSGIFVMGEIQNLAGRGPESPALTEPLISVEWREAPARAHGTLEVMLSFQHPFLSQLVFKTYCSHPSFSCLFKASKRATLTFCVKPCTATT